MTTTTTLTVQEVVARSGLSEATLRYYERLGLIDEVPRDATSRHRRYPEATVASIEALACLRTAGFGIDDMRRYRSSLDPADPTAQRTLFEEHAARLAAEAARLADRRAYIDQKVALWSARERHDAAAERAAAARLLDLATRL